jgi:hypothetical protein
MPSMKRRASKLLNEYGAAQSELIGKAVVLTDGKAGTVVCTENFIRVDDAPESPKLAE